MPPKTFEAKDIPAIKKQLFEETKALRDKFKDAPELGLNISDQEIMDNIDAKFGMHIDSYNYLETIEDNIEENKKIAKEQNPDHVSLMRGAEYRMTGSNEFKTLMKENNDIIKKERLRDKTFYNLLNANYEKVLEATIDVKKGILFAQSNQMLLEAGYQSCTSYETKDGLGLSPQIKKLVLDNAMLVQESYVKIKNNLTFLASPFNFLFKEGAPSISEEKANKISLYVTMHRKDKFNPEKSVENKKLIESVLALPTICNVDVFKKMKENLQKNQVYNILRFKGKDENVSITKALIEDKPVVKRPDLEYENIKDDFKKYDLPYIYSKVKNPEKSNPVLKEEIKGYNYFLKNNKNPKSDIFKNVNKFLGKEITLDDFKDGKFVPQKKDKVKENKPKEQENIKENKPIVNEAPIKENKPIQNEVPNKENKVVQEAQPNKENKAVQKEPAQKPMVEEDPEIKRQKEELFKQTVALRNSINKKYAAHIIEESTKLPPNQRVGLDVVRIKTTDEEIRKIIDRKFDVYKFSHDFEKKRLTNFSTNFNYLQNNHFGNRVQFRKADAQSFDPEAFKKYVEQTNSVAKCEQFRAQQYEKIMNFDINKCIEAYDDLSKLPELLKGNEMIFNLGFTSTPILDNTDGPLFSNNFKKEFKDNKLFYESSFISIKGILTYNSTPYTMLFDDRGVPEKDDFADLCFDLQKCGFLQDLEKNKNIDKEMLGKSIVECASTSEDKKSIEYLKKAFNRKDKITNLSEYKSADPNKSLCQAMLDGTEIVKKTDEELKAMHDELHMYDNEVTRENLSNSKTKNLVSAAEKKRYKNFVKSKQEDVYLQRKNEKSNRELPRKLVSRLKIKNVNANNIIQDKKVLQYLALEERHNNRSTGEKILEAILPNSLTATGRIANEMKEKKAELLSLYGIGEHELQLYRNAKAEIEQNEANKQNNKEQVENKSVQPEAKQNSNQKTNEINKTQVNTIDNQVNVHRNQLNLGRNLEETKPTLLTESALLKNDPTKNIMNVNDLDMKYPNIHNVNVPGENGGNKYAEDLKKEKGGKHQLILDQQINSTVVENNDVHKSTEDVKINS